MPWNDELLEALTETEIDSLDELNDQCKVLTGEQKITAIRKYREYERELLVACEGRVLGCGMASAPPSTCRLGFRDLAECSVEGANRTLKHGEKCRVSGCKLNALQATWLTWAYLGPSLHMKLPKPRLVQQPAHRLQEKTPGTY